MMAIHIATDVVGILALDDQGNLIDKVLFDRKPEEIADRLIELEKSTPIKELLELLERLKGRKVVLEDPELARRVSSTIQNVEIASESPDPILVEFRRRFWEDYLPKLGISKEEYQSLLLEVSDIITRRKLRQAVEKRDLFIAQSISTVDDIDKTLNLIASRIREWYGIHFPELEELVRDNKEYVALVRDIGHRSRYTLESVASVLKGAPEERIKRIVEAAKKSIGADMSDWDLDQIKAYADIYLRLDEYRNKLSEYIDEAMKDVAPNVRELVGPLLGARLIKLAGGLMRLAMLPASTIQVLGAEKALFRALRTGGKPPKHGVIFQYPEIFRAPRWQRGKIARALAAKLAIAAKADAFTGNFIAAKLKEDLLARIQEVKTLYAKPPPRAPQPKPAQRQPERRQGPPPKKPSLKKPSKKE
ncbi:C/D box methylation guide ribonucleoprotein complex aNOP56 subunit [Thermoproteus tenax]|nr:C/D box methylation guide ribonucleoprotein complex aNOP56 subunit [Thermoproteus tenax]